MNEQLKDLLLEELGACWHKLDTCGNYEDARYYRERIKCIDYLLFTSSPTEMMQMKESS